MMPIPFNEKTKNQKHNSTLQISDKAHITSFSKVTGTPKEKPIISHWNKRDKYKEWLRKRTSLGPVWHEVLRSRTKWGCIQY